MKVIKFSLIGLLIVIVLFIGSAFLIPAQWQVSRSVVINAHAEKIYEHISDLHKWLQWSPWTGEKDPSLVYTYEGPESGVGAQQNWTSEEMGRGWLRIDKGAAESGISYTLFIDMGMMKSTLNGDISYKAKDSGLEVTWTDRGDSGNNPIKRWMGLFMESMLGPDLKKGLESLKELVEE